MGLLFSSPTWSYPLALELVPDSAIVTDLGTMRKDKPTLSPS